MKETLDSALLVSDLIALCQDLEKELAKQGYGSKSTELDELAVSLCILLKKIKT